jgi:F-type H+-transporting ATPase subunit epsilon
VSHTFELEIVIPDRLVVRGRVEETEIPGRNGYLGILPGHAPLITELAISEVSYRENGESPYLAVAWGFAEVLPNQVIILAETAGRAEQIDMRRAEEAKKCAEQRLKSNNPSIDCARAQRALTRAATRLKVAGRQEVPFTSTKPRASAHDQARTV